MKMAGTNIQTCRMLFNMPRPRSHKSMRDSSTAGASYSGSFQDANESVETIRVAAGPTPTRAERSRDGHSNERPSLLTRPNYLFFTSSKNRSKSLTPLVVTLNLKSW
jgi:hypothetical protein